MINTAPVERFARNRSVSSYFMARGFPKTELSAPDRFDVRITAARSRVANSGRACAGRSSGRCRLLRCQAVTQLVRWATSTTSR
jgi:hypothetical protein